MGHNAIYALLSLMILFSINNNGFNEKEIIASANSYGYVKTMTAQSISRGVLDLAVSRYENGGSFPYSGVLNGASFTVTATFVGDTMRLGESSTYDDSQYVITTNYVRYAKPFPDPGACLGLSMDPIPSTLYAAGYNDTTDNRNFNLAGTIAGPTSTYDVSVLNKADSIAVKALIGLSSLKAINITSTAQKIDVNSELPSPSPYMNEYLADADSSFTTSSTITGSRKWGSETNPMVILVSGDSLRSAYIGGTVEGWGVLVLQRNVSFTGSFKWHGLVVATTNPALNFTYATGQPMIVGSMLMTAPPTGVPAVKGNLTLRYSSAANAMAQNNVRKLQAYKLLNWYE